MLSCQEAKRQPGSAYNFSFPLNESNRMSIIGSIIADAANVAQGYAQRLQKDIPAERFARFSAPGDVAITANHPAFIYGHLSLYPAKVMELLGTDLGATQPPADFETLFSKTATCQDDPTGEIYPDSETILAFYAASYEAALATLRDAADELLGGENPVESPLKQKCPTLGALLNFYMLGHVTTHLGQLSTWRRMEGMSPA